MFDQDGYVRIFVYVLWMVVWKIEVKFKVEIQEGCATRMATDEVRSG